YAVRLGVVAKWEAGALGSRPEARAWSAAGTDRQTANERNRRLLRICRPRTREARNEGRRQRHRLRTAAPARAGDPLRPAGWWAAPGAARGWLHRDPRCGHSGV